MAQSSNKTGDVQLIFCQFGIACCCFCSVLFLCGNLLRFFHQVFPALHFFCELFFLLRFYLADVVQFNKVGAVGSHIVVTLLDFLFQCFDIGLDGFVFFGFLIAEF